MTFNLGSAVMFIAGGRIEDLEEAIYYIQDEIKRVPDNDELNFSYGKLPLDLASTMSKNRGSAVKAVCLGDTKSLKEALGYLGMEIEELKHKAKEEDQV